MKNAKKKRLEAQGWRVGSAQDFLGLSGEEAAIVETKLRLSRGLRERRTRLALSQAACQTSAFEPVESGENGGRGRHGVRRPIAEGPVCTGRDPKGRGGRHSQASVLGSIAGGADSCPVRQGLLLCGALRVARGAMTRHSSAAPWPRPAAAPRSHRRLSSAARTPPPRARAAPRAA